MGTTVRDANECKRAKVERGKCYDRCVLVCLLGRHGFQLNGLESSCGSEGPVEVKVGAG